MSYEVFPAFSADALRRSLLLNNIEMIKTTSIKSGNPFFSNQILRRCDISYTAKTLDSSNSNHLNIATPNSSLHKALILYLLVYINTYSNDKRLTAELLRLRKIFTYSFTL